MVSRPIPIALGQLISLVIGKISKSKTPAGLPGPKDSSSGRSLFGLYHRLVRIPGRLSGDRLPSLNGRCDGGILGGGESMGQFVQEKAIVGSADDGGGFGGEEGPDGAGEVEGLGVHVEADVLA
jgi:hypothetical protein